MRKRVHLIAALSAAMILAAGMPVISFAAGGWQRERVGEEEAWVYLDGDGNRMSDVLLEYGNDIYYLDSNGIMAANQWVLYPRDPVGQEAGVGQDGSDGWGGGRKPMPRPGTISAPPARPIGGPGKSLTAETMSLTGTAA